MSYYDYKKLNSTPRVLIVDAMADDSKTLEIKVKTLLDLFIYAAMDDIQADWNGAPKFSDHVNQSYQNLIKSKEQKITSGLIGRFTVQTEVHQQVAFLFTQLIAELRNVHFTEHETAVTIREKVADANVECFADFMMGLHADHKDQFGAVLKSAGDTTQWFRGKIVGGLPSIYATQQVLMAILSAEFEGFLKALGWLIAKFLWYNKQTVSKDVFMGWLAQQKMSQNFLDMLELHVRARPPKKVGVKKAAAATDPAVESAAPAPVVTPVAEVDAGIADLLNLV